MIRRWLLWLALAVLLAGCIPGRSPSGATVTVTFPGIAATEADLVNPMRGYYRWYGGEPIPQQRAALDQYVRYGWRQLEPSRGVYDFSAIEQEMEAARRVGAKFSFRVMSVNEFSSPVEVPDYLGVEAGGTYCEYNGQQVWVPDWDSPAFLERARALVEALGSAFDGDVRLGYYDIGIYGHWGEWHTSELCAPPASAATKRALVDMQIDAFKGSRLLMNSGADEVDAFVYALGKSPRIGVRVDSLCNSWFDEQFTRSAQKLALMQERWRTAPIVTEFFSHNPADLGLCSEQVRRWHVAATANGRLDWANYTAEQQGQLLALGKATGYRFALGSVSYPATAAAGSQLTITSAWSNDGITPAYEPFQAVFALHQAGASEAVWRQPSQIDFERLLPTEQPIGVVDQLTLPDHLAPGSYILSLSVEDPTGYRPPLQLASAGADAAGRYILGQIAIR